METGYGKLVTVYIDLPKEINDFLATSISILILILDVYSSLIDIWKYLDDIWKIHHLNWKH